MAKPTLSPFSSPPPEADTAREEEMIIANGRGQKNA